MTRPMRLSRRAVLGASGAALLAGCLPQGITAFDTDGLPPDLRPTSNAGYEAWVQSFKARARAQGITQATLDAAFNGTGYLPGVVARDRNQAEFTRSLEDYFALVASEAKVTAGRAAFTNQTRLLSRIELRFGTSPDVVAAIWGVESEFGARRGDIPVISAVSTLAFDGRRGAFFEAQLLAALRILQQGHTTPDRLIGSWAGAMGHTQFIPTSFDAYAIDFDGDGRKDIWGTDPTDALASTAAYLAQAGNWRRGLGLGAEVILPDGYSGPSGRGTWRAVADWQARGIRPAADLPELGEAALLRPAGNGGPAFLVSRNFEAVMRYNASESYVLGVLYMAGRLRGTGPLVGRFPPDEWGLLIEDRIALQEGLARQGFDVGRPDGVIGTKTTEAIRAYQTRAGLPVTGTPSRALVQALGG